MRDFQHQTREHIDIQLDRMKTELTELYEARLKQLSHSANNSDKKLDKAAANILTAVDKKMTKDCELKQKIFYKLDERLNQLETDLTKKSTELTNLFTSKLMSSKTEFNESLNEVKRGFRTLAEQIDIESISKHICINISIGTLITQDRETIEDRLQSLENSNDQIDNRLIDIQNNQNFISEIGEDIEQLKSHIRSVELRTKEELKSIPDFEAIRGLVSNSILENLQNYSKLADLKNLKSEVTEFKREVEKNTTDSAYRAEDMKEQIYSKLLTKFRNEYDPKLGK